MNIDDVLNSVTPDIYEKFKRAIELGKWADGRVLTQAQRETCMQALIAYEFNNLPEEERSGFVPAKETPCGPNTNEQKPLKWKNENK